MNDLLESQPDNIVGYLQTWIKNHGSKFEDQIKSYEGQLPTSDEDEDMNSDEEQ